MASVNRALAACYQTCKIVKKTSPVEEACQAVILLNETFDLSNPQRFEVFSHAYMNEAKRISPTNLLSRFSFTDGYEYRKRPERPSRWVTCDVDKPIAAEKARRDTIRRVMMFKLVAAVHHLDITTANVVAGEHMAATTDVASGPLSTRTQRRRSKPSVSKPAKKNIYSRNPTPLWDIAALPPPRADPAAPKLHMSHDRDCIWLNGIPHCHTGMVMRIRCLH
ncbi:hypothetical protein LTR53_000645 [Teratosphaeriaceae sp. CCFEE 6253]|nr:hypothetical protein LTR53_000645 [Teratosphaeriaceae sp. CCFEE 6253]